MIGGAEGKRRGNTINNNKNNMGGGIDIASLLGGLGNGAGGGLQFKFHGNYCGLNHGDGTYHYYQLML